ncbi:MAG TPA: HEAT repeat domain-containing protein [Allocoleopsis sp.]
MTDSLRTQNLIQAVEQADSAERLVESVRALVACYSEAAIPTLIAVFGYNNPGAAMVAIEGLIRLGEPAVLPLLEQLDDYNYGARAYSIRALAAIADPRALEVLATAALTDFAPSVRRAAAKGLGTLHWHQLPQEQVREAQATALQALLQVSQDPDWAIRYAAVVGLQTLASGANNLKVPIQNRFEQMLSSEADAAVRARVLRAKQLLDDSNAIALNAPVKPVA